MKRLTQIVYVGWLLLLPWQTHYVLTASNNPFGELRLYGFDIGFIILVSLFVWHWYHSAEKIRWPVLWIYLTVFALVGCSAYWAEDRSVSFYYWIRLGEAFIAGGISLSQLITSRFILIPCLINGLIQSGFIFYQTISQHIAANSWLGMAAQHPDVSGTPVVVTTTGRFLRAFGTMPHPNIVAAILVLSLISAVLLWQNNLNARRYLILIAMPVLTLALILTFSRGAILAWFIFCIGSMITDHFKHSALQYSALLMLLVAGVIYFPLITSRITANSFVEQISITERSQQFKQGWQFLEQHWTTGLGVGNYSVIIDHHEPIHFTPLLLAVELGIMTTLLYYYLFGITLWYTPLGNSGRLLLVSMFIMSIFDHYFWTIPSMIILWFITLALVQKKS